MTHSQWGLLVTFWENTKWLTVILNTLQHHDMSLNWCGENENHRRTSRHVEPLKVPAETAHH